MQPGAVVEAHDVVSNVGLCLYMVGIVTLLNALHHGVIPTISFATHASNESMARQQCAALCWALAY